QGACSRNSRLSREESGFMGKSHAEDRTRMAVFNPNCALMQLRHEFAEGQTEPMPGALLSARLNLREAIEDVLTHGLGDASSLVCDAQLDFCAVGARAYAHRASAGRVAQGVVD